jgi:hypothetical protein
MKNCFRNPVIKGYPFSIDAIQESIACFNMLTEPGEFLFVVIGVRKEGE